MVGGARKPEADLLRHFNRSVFRVTVNNDSNQTGMVKGISISSVSRYYRYQEFMLRSLF